MKAVFLLSLLGLSSLCRADELQGTWFFYRKIYNGQEILEPPDASLRLYFQFDGQGHDYLYWRHMDDASYCGRKGNYQFDGATLHDEIFWVDPKNSGDCGRDPDMLLGRVTDTPLQLVNGEIQLVVPLGDEALIYVWKKIAAP